MVAHKHRQSIIGRIRKQWCFLNRSSPSSRMQCSFIHQNMLHQQFTHHFFFLHHSRKGDGYARGIIHYHEA